MSETTVSHDALRSENAALRARLAESEERLNTIRAGAVDAMVVEGDGRLRLFTLQWVDEEQKRARRELFAQVSGDVIEVALGDRADRARIHSALQDGEERLGAFLKNSAIIGWLKDEDLRYVFVTENYERLLGVHAADWQGKTDGELWPHGVAELFRRNDLAVIASGHSVEVVEYSIDTAGLATWWLSNRFTFRDAAGRRFVGGFAVDITERTRAEEALRASEERFRAFVTASSDVIYRMNTDWSEMRLLYGRDFLVDTTQPSRHWLTQYICDEDQPGVMAAITDAIGAKRIFSLEHRVRRADGTVGWTLSRAVPLLDAQGEITEWIGTASDITARKVAEESEARLAAIVESSQDAIVSKDLGGTITSWNQGAEAIFGYAAEEIIGQSILRLIPTERRQEESDILARVARGESVRHFETVRLRKDGSSVEVSITVSPVKDAHGRIVGVSKLAEEITERRRVEARLRDNAELFSTLIAQAPMGTYVIDAQFRMRQINAEAMPSFASVEPVIGRDFDYVLTTLWGPEVGKAIADRFRDTLASGERYISPPFTEWRRDLGVEETYEWQAQRVTLPDGQFGVVCYFHDVTERARSNEANRAGEQRMRLATEATGVGVWEWNLLTDEISWDAEMYRIYGVEPTATGSVTYADWRGAVLPEDLEETESVLRDTVKACGRSARTFRIRRRDDGELRYLEAVETVRTDAEGKAAWVVGTNLDITERRRAEEELRRLATELSEADRRKDEFLATLAHELRNPLAPIRNSLQLIRLSNGTGGAFEKALNMLDRQSAQMVHLVDDLLDVSRITLGKLELRRRRIDLATVLHSAMESSRPLIEARAHQFIVELPPQPVFVDADLLRLGQVFTNLLNNAAKYTAKGGRIRLAVEPQASSVLVRVTDNGVGIAAEMLPSIFEMFTQLDRSLERSQGGLGIGLCLAKRLAELHGGRIEAKSEGLGLGSEFVVSLPVAASAETVARVAADEGDPDRRSGKRRIIVADDNEDAADSLATLLRFMGNDVSTVNDGAAAVELAAAIRPDVILLDLGMPKLNGFEACRRLRQEPWGKKAILIALTGWGQTEDKQRSQEAGFDHHLVKPVEYAALSSLLASVRPPE